MSENIAEDIIGVIVILYLVALGAKIVHTGYQIFSYNGFKGFTNKTTADYAGSNRSKWKKAAKSFKVSVRKLKKMTKKEIKDLYRKMAMKNHPDKGGDPEDFRNLHEAYEFAYAA